MEVNLTLSLVEIQKLKEMLEELIHNKEELYTVRGILLPRFNEDHIKIMIRRE